MTHTTLTLAAIFAIALLLHEAWERGREYGLAERRRVLDVRYPVVPVEDEYSVTGIGS